MGWGNPVQVGAADTQRLLEKPVEAVSTVTPVVADIGITPTELPEGSAVTSTLEDVEIPASIQMLNATASPTVPSTNIEASDSETVTAPELPQMSVFPNPARGLQATFRFQSVEAFSYQISLYDRFGDAVTILTGAGKDLVDVVWPLVQVPEGLYYYRVSAFHSASGTAQRLPVGRLAVDKTPASTPTPTPKKKKNSVKVKKPAKVKTPTPQLNTNEPSP
jgi:hypothetical protein